MRFGNWLYLWLDAHTRTCLGDPTLVLAAPGMASWLDAFPALASLTITRDQLRFHDRREWSSASPHQRFGDDFDRDSLDDFVRAAIVPHVEVDSSDEIALHVRRGDYYRDAGFRALYGIDVLRYLRAALPHVAPGDRAVVFSDDPQWCRQNVEPVIRESVARVRYAEGDAISDFRALAGHRRIVGTNSTFSYWAGYTSGVLHDDARVVMPRFHARMEGWVTAPQLDPRWTAIEGLE